MEFQLVNPESGYSKAKFIEPSSAGYIHIGAAVNPRLLPFTLLPAGRRKAELIGRLKELANQLDQCEKVETVTVFEAVGIPPMRRFPYIRERADSLHLARFDIAVIIEVSSPAVIGDVQETPVYQRLIHLIETEATDIHVMAARNEKRVGDVDKTRDDLFIFNYFVAEDVNVFLELMEYTAGWYVAETGLDNSTLLVPLDEEDADYVGINNSSVNSGVLRFLWQQFSKKSFRDYLLANLKANHVGSMPVLYRRA